MLRSYVPHGTKWIGEGEVINPTLKITNPEKSLEQWGMKFENLGDTF